MSRSLIPYFDLLRGQNRSIPLWCRVVAKEGHPGLLRKKFTLTFFTYIKSTQRVTCWPPSKKVSIPPPTRNRKESDHD